MVDFQIPLDYSIRFFLVLFRVGSIIAFVPFYGHRTFPAQLKISLSILLTFIVMPITGDFVAPEQLIPLIMAVLREILIGFLIGFSTQLTFTSIQFGAELITIQMGLSMATQVDPNFNEQSTIVAQLYNFLALIIFISLKGHYIFITAIAQTFDFVPIGKFNFSSELARQLAQIFANLFVAGFQVAAPVFIALFMATIASGLISRSIPQMNIFMVMPPIQIIVGIIMLILSIHATIFTMQVLFKKLGVELPTIIANFQ